MTDEKQPAIQPEPLIDEEVVVIEEEDLDDADGFDDVAADASDSAETDAPKKAKGRKGSGAGRHAKAASSAYIQKSTRMRNVLIVVVVLLVALLVAICVLGFQIFDAARNTAVQQTQVTDAAGTATEEQASDASPTVAKKTTVPNLVSLLGKTQDEAVAELAHGAQVTRTLEVNEEGNPIRTDVQIALTEEPSDSRTGTPTVYLGIAEAGNIVRAGYSVATSSLGYGSLSFTDAVENEHIVEKTLDEAGLTVSVGAAQLPPDKTEYSTYDSDGTTLVKEYYAFTGVGQATGVEHSWEAILSYDYSMANATGNLNDTIRTIFIYIS